MAEISYRRHRFPPVIIQHAVWLYLRFTLSYPDVEELLAERGLDISYETVRCWVLKFGPVIARRLRRCRPRPSNRWHLNEMVVRIAGERMYLWRAVDHEGEVLDMLVQRRRDTPAALRLMRKLLKKQGFAPKLLVTDKLRSYASAFRRLRLTCSREQRLRRNRLRRDCPPSWSGRQALLDDRVALVPQGKAKAQIQLIVAEPGDPVLAPAVGAAARMVVREVVPGAAVLAVILADGAPLPLAEIGPPAPPGDSAVRFRKTPRPSVSPRSFFAPALLIDVIGLLPRRCWPSQINTLVELDQK